MFGCFLADEKGVKECTGCKGSGGRKPCLCCMNVIGRGYTPATVPSGGVLVHYSEPVAAKCKPHTRETILSIADHLSACASRHPPMPPGQWTELQKNLGFDYCPQGLIWSPMRAVAALPDSVYWDWMHCIVASGGVAQHEVNQFLLRLARLWPLSEIEALMTAIVFPKCYGKLSLKLADRVGKKKKSHIKAFSSEVVMLITALGAVSDMLLGPVAKLQQESECFRLLVRIVDMLRGGDKNAGRHEELRELIEQHQRRYMALYPTCVKPKLHYAQHLPACWARFGRNLSCFAPERKHRVSKRLGAFCFNQMAKTLTIRCARQELRALEVSDSMEQFAFEPAPLPKALKPEEIMVLAAYELLPPAGGPVAVRAGHLKTHHGVLKADDVIAFTTEDAHVDRGFARIFLRVPAAAGAVSFYALVTKLRGAGAARYAAPRDDAANCLVNALRLRGACPFFRAGDFLHVIDEKLWW